jgi:hypothetical protein
VRYASRTFIGFVLISFGWVVIAYALYQLLQTGTCASGGPYVSARQCPAGTERLILMIPTGIFAILIGAGFYSGRGKAPGSDRPPNQGLLILWVWTGIFWSIAIGCFLAIWGPDANPPADAKLGGLIVGFIFVPMGAGGLLALNLRGRKERGAAAALGVPGTQRILKAAVKRMPATDPVAKLERLEKLREQGTVTEDEFAKLKQQILSGGEG